MIALILFLVIIMLDQLTKYAVRSSLAVGENIPLLPFLSLTHVQNTGAAFGLFKDMQLVLSIVSLAVLGLVIFFYVREDSRHMQYSFALFTGGIVGNLVERVFRGAVTDFIALPYWPAFNVADSAITLSVLAMIYFVVVRKED